MVQTYHVQKISLNLGFNSEKDLLSARQLIMSRWKWKDVCTTPYVTFYYDSEDDYYFSSGSTIRIMDRIDCRDNLASFVVKRQLPLYQSFIHREEHGNCISFDWHSQSPFNLPITGFITRYHPDSFEENPSHLIMKAANLQIRSKKILIASNELRIEVSFDHILWFDDYFGQVANRSFELAIETTLSLRAHSLSTAVPTCISAALLEFSSFFQDNDLGSFLTSGKYETYKIANERGVSMVKGDELKRYIHPLLHD